MPITLKMFMCIEQYYVLYLNICFIEVKHFYHLFDIVENKEKALKEFGLYALSK